MSEQEEQAIPDEFVGYGPASRYLGIERNTLSSYVARGTGPAEVRRIPRGGSNFPVFTRAELDAWKASRPGQGARTDLPAKANDQFAEARATAHSLSLPFVEADGTISRGE